MGLLTLGSPLSWQETKKYADYIRKHGILQFIHIYNKLKERKNDYLKWGDEVEYTLIYLDDEKKQARLLLKGHEVLTELRRKEDENAENLITLWRPEYAAYMVEGTPGRPYGGLISHFNMVEANMRARKEEVKALLGPNEHILCITAFPRIGCPSFTQPEASPDPNNSASRSLFYPDEAIYAGHPRFKTLTRNIRERRGEKVAMNLPIFRDSATPKPFVEDFSALGDDGEAARVALPDHVYLDAMGFGMGCCCLQMTFQAQDITEARYLYDQLTPLTPIVLAMSAATPCFRGYLTDVDCRWNVISGSVDDRTREERGIEPLKNDRFVINKSRYDTIDSYLSECSAPFNDIPLVMDEELLKMLLEAGIDETLSRHIAHLFIRDPVVVYGEKMNIDDEEDSDHFENIQSTNWQNMRFKPPPHNSSIGWRIEFRPTELQLTEFENAAFVVFVVLLTRVIATFQLNLLIPISQVDANLQTAQKKDAVLRERFHFRQDLLSCDSPLQAHECCGGRPNGQQEGPKIGLMTIDEIVNGKAGEFAGLIPLINSYLGTIEADVDTHCSIRQYLKFISLRASGKLRTTARWIRDFVAQHPDYKHDSVVSSGINYDLIKTMVALSAGDQHIPNFSYNARTKTVDTLPSSVLADNPKLVHDSVLQ